MATPITVSSRSPAHRRLAIYPSTPQPQRRSFCLDQLPSSLPSSPLLQHRKSLSGTRPASLKLPQKQSFEFPNLPLPSIPHDHFRSRTSSFGPLTSNYQPRSKHTLSLIEVSCNNLHYLPAQVELLDKLKVPHLQSLQQFNIHSSQCIEVVTISDSHGTKYYLPLNSTVKFGLMSHLDSTKSLLKRVSDILTLPMAPKVICPQINVIKKHHKYADKGDVLIVNEASEQYLKCYNLQKKEFIMLEHSLKGNFTTAPSSTKLPLKDLIGLIPHALPCMAKIFLPPHVVSTVPEMQSGHVVSISEQSFITSLTATLVDQDGMQYILLPMVGDMGMVMVRTVTTLDARATQLLHQTTQHINQTFQQKHFTFTRNISDTSVFSLQAQLFSEAAESTDGDDKELYVQMSSPTSPVEVSDKEPIYAIPDDIKANEHRNQDFLSSLSVAEVNLLL